MSTMSPVGGVVPGRDAGCLISMNRLSMSRIRMARAPSANVTGLPPASQPARWPAWPARASHRYRAPRARESRAGILHPQRNRLVLDVLNLHHFDSDSRAGYSRRLVALLRSSDVEHREQLRIRAVVRPFTGSGQRRHFHAEDIVVEGQRAVHVLDERGERAGADDRALARVGRSGWRRLADCRRASKRYAQRRQSHMTSIGTCLLQARVRYTGPPDHDGVMAMPSTSDRLKTRHSAWSAATGSSRIARRAGTALATTPAATSTTATPANTKGFAPPVPTSIAGRTVATAAAPAVPRTSPIATCHSVAPVTVHQTRRASAPSATRTLRFPAFGVRRHTPSLRRDRRSPAASRSTRRSRTSSRISAAAIVGEPGLRPPCSPDTAAGRRRVPESGPERMRRPPRARTPIVRDEHPVGRIARVGTVDDRIEFP